MRDEVSFHAVSTRICCSAANSQSRFGDGRVKSPRSEAWRGSPGDRGLPPTGNPGNLGPRRAPQSAS